MSFFRLLRTALSDPIYAGSQLYLRAGGKFNSVLAKQGAGCFPPQRLFFLLTYQSDFKSQNSILWGEKGFCKNFPPEKLAQELPAEILFRVLSDVRRFRPEIVVFGAEPLQNEKCLPFLREAKRLGFKTLLATEGFHLEKFAKELVQVADQVVVQLDGVEKTCDEVKSIPGAFDKIWSGIAALDREKKAQNQTSPRLKIGALIDEKNCKKVSEMVDYLTLSGIDIDACFFEEPEFISSENLNKHAQIFSQQFSCETMFWKGCRDAGAEINWNVLAQQVGELQKPCPFPIFIARQPQNTQALKCKAIFSEAKILPGGDVWICPDYSIGNLKVQSFRDLWNDHRSKLFRKYHLRSPNFPACVGCHGLR